MAKWDKSRYSSFHGDDVMRHTDLVEEIGNFEDEQFQEVCELPVSTRSFRPECKERIGDYIFLFPELNAEDFALAEEVFYDGVTRLSRRKKFKLFVGAALYVASDRGNNPISQAKIADRLGVHQGQLSQYIKAVSEAVYVE